jgi:hypothetical protein
LAYFVLGLHRCVGVAGSASGRDVTTAVCEINSADAGTNTACALLYAVAAGATVVDGANCANASSSGSATCVTASGGASGVACGGLRAEPKPDGLCAHLVYGLNSAPTGEPLVCVGGVAAAARAPPATLA